MSNYSIKFVIKDMLIEWRCGEKDWRYSEEYECPHGCQDGACIQEEFEEPEEVPGEDLE